MSATHFFSILNVLLRQLGVLILEHVHLYL